MEPLLSLLLLLVSVVAFSQPSTRVNSAAKIKWNKPIKARLVLAPTLFKPFVTTTDTEAIKLPTYTEPTGVNLGNPIDLTKLLSSESEAELLQLAGILEQVIFPDKNPRSGTYYYFPNAFNLNFDQSSGKYDFKISYPQGEEVEDVMVQVSAGFRPDAKSALLDLVQNMVGSSGKLLSSRERLAFRKGNPPHPVQGSL